MNGRSANDGDGLDQLEHKEACERAVAELAQLPDHQRGAGAVIEGMTLRQIADATGLTVSNVGYRVTQGLENWRDGETGSG